MYYFYKNILILDLIIQLYSDLFCLCNFLYREDVG